MPAPADPVFLPDLAGLRAPVRAPHAKGGWLGLTPETRREALMAASYRGVAYGLRRILARIEDFVGRQRVITVSGGYDVDPAWLQLRANVYDRPIAFLETTEPTALGAAILAAAGIGLYPGLAAAVRASARRDGRSGSDPGTGRGAAPGLCCAGSVSATPCSTPGIRRAPEARQSTRYCASASRSSSTPRPGAVGAASWPSVMTRWSMVSSRRRREPVSSAGRYSMNAQPAVAAA